MKIEILDSIHCRASRDLIPLLYDLFLYPVDTWRPKKSGFGKEKRIRTGSFIHKGTGIFPTGLLSQAKEYLQKRDLNYNIDGFEERLTPQVEANLPGGEFWDIQKPLVNIGIKKQRGIILGATGTGKTIVTLGILSAFPNHSVLLLCHSLSILRQTKKKFEKYGIKDCCLFDGNHKTMDKRIVLGSIQSFRNLDPYVYMDQFDITIIDEGHHLNSKTCVYAEVMQRNFSPIRLAFTATLPETKLGKLALEAYTGPVIGEVSIQDGINAGVLAKPFITLLNPPINSAISDMERFYEIYPAAITFSKTRNSLIVEESSKRIKAGKSILIMVKSIAHGELLQDIFKISGIKVQYVQGKTDSEIRENTRLALDNKEISCVISTVIWKEGVDIPSLDVVINAASGKSRIATIQIIGRGTRAPDGKTEVEIIDFLDQYRYLDKHTVLRLRVYVENEWL